MDFLSSIDISLFYFFNGTIHNVVFDALMPVITDLNKYPAVLVLVLGVWVWMLVKGGTEGRQAAILLALSIAFTDQLNSSWLKHVFERVRPCHSLDDVRLLVSCGSGFSFPSSHAVNNFGAATVLSLFYRKWTWAFFAVAATVGLSRVYVGVHYPFDVLVGAVVGAACGFVIVWIGKRLMGYWKSRHTLVEEKKS